ncbi:hypothetical protein [Thermoanaerobacterium sp. RBIITD]|uniref:hypothetical protein n=1 Tax=Thermoanaerobacterium sp. RBIITD TaxID=1550240 RepID=UPI000BB7955E|nr:hypothetical protein [Thermoanaerobacterium sp. RBIITD]SNX52630.1 hypothetical protein SAMN05660242_0040 [Thermoanaerobacterium sp. RBIITD]
MKRFLVSPLLCLTLVFSTTVGFAANENKKDENWEIRRAFIEKNMIKLGENGYQSVDDFLTKNGFEKANNIKSFSIITPDSSNGSVKFINMSGYRDRLSGKYL